MAKVRHSTLFGEAHNLPLGLVKLDHQGFPVNLDELPSGAEDKLLGMGWAGYVSNEDFPLTRTPDPNPNRYKDPEDEKQQVAAEGHHSIDEPAREQSLRGDGLDSDILAVVEGLLEDSRNLNSEGKLRLEALNSALREKKLGKLSGELRDLYVAAFTK